MKWVGDAARYNFLMRRCEHAILDFDLELAKKAIQWKIRFIMCNNAHARICSIVRMAQETRALPLPVYADIDLSVLNEPEEKTLIKLLVRYIRKPFTAPQIF